MPILFMMTMPEGTPIDMVGDVTKLMGVKEDPPAGLIVHTHYEQAGRVHIVDVWESVEAHDAFGQHRLGPALAKVAAERGMDLSQGPPPEGTVIELDEVVRGR
jgi:hypothetical protein